METPKTALLGRTLDEIQQIVRNLGMPKFAAKQITSWLYDKKVETIDEMTNLSSVSYTHLTLPTICSV